MHRCWRTRFGVWNTATCRFRGEEATINGGFTFFKPCAQHLSLQLCVSKSKELLQAVAAVTSLIRYAEVTVERS